MRAALGKQLSLQRIENIAGTGMPDIVALGSYGSTLTKQRRRARTTFVELKAQEDPPVRATTPALGTKKGLSIDQRNWHLAWAQCGGVSLVVIGVGCGQRRKVFAVPGALADNVNKLSVAALQPYACTWAELSKLLGAKR
jgi:hypothetical protein